MYNLSHNFSPPHASASIGTALHQQCLPTRRSARRRRLRAVPRVGRGEAAGRGWEVALMCSIRVVGWMQCQPAGSWLGPAAPAFRLVWRHGGQGACRVLPKTKPNQLGRSYPWPAAAPCAQRQQHNIATATTTTTTDPHRGCGRARPPRSPSQGAPARPGQQAERGSGQDHARARRLREGRGGGVEAGGCATLVTDRGDIWTSVWG